MGSASKTTLALGAAVFALAFAVSAQRHMPAFASLNSPWKQVATIHVPDVSRARLKPLEIFSFGSGAVDSLRKTYLLADRTNRSVDVFDTQRNVLLNQIFVGGCRDCSFTGVDPRFALPRSGPNGIVPIPGSTRAWVGDVGSIKVLDYVAGRITQSITITSDGMRSLYRSDSGCYDSRDHLLMFTNPDDPIPFVSLIDTSSSKIVARAYFPASLGLQDCLYDSVTMRFYVEVVGTPLNQTGEVDAFAVSAIRHGDVMDASRYPTPDCSPRGFATGGPGIALIGCDAIAVATPRFDLIDHVVPLRTDVLDLHSGKLLRSISSIGGADSAAFDQRTHRWYVVASRMTLNGNPGGAAEPVIGVIDARTHRWVENFPLPEGATSITIDDASGHIFMPVPQSTDSDGGVFVFTDRQS